MTNSRRGIEWRLFLLAWLAYAFFHQGGGWNQNGRFAMVRAIVEEGRFAIDSYYFYSGTEPAEAGERLIRTPIIDGGFTLRGRERVLAWPGTAQTPLRKDAGGLPIAPLDSLGCTGDLSAARGRLYPNKAPGTALLAVPAYFVIYHGERLAGIDPDGWWVLTLNAWLTTALSIGIVSAAGCVLFLRAALLLWGTELSAAVWATLAFAFGTLYFPYATMLYEHNVVAIALLAAFYLLRRSAAEPDAGGARVKLTLAGLAAGWAAVATYIAVVPVLLLAGYLMWKQPRRRAWLWYGLGLVGPFLVACGYQWACFGTPWTTNYHFQNPEFIESGAFLNVFGPPRLERLVALLVSPFRGLFFSSPVLLVGFAGLAVMWRHRPWRAEATLFGALFAFFLLFNLCFNGWDGGWGVGPRYLVPALPFVALPLTLGFARWFKTTAVLAALSIATMTIVTAVDPQPPVGSSALAARPGRARLLREPLSEYLLPILLTGRPKGLLELQKRVYLRSREVAFIEQGMAEEERKATLEKLSREADQSIAKGGREFTLAEFVGPVSVNPVGMYEKWLGHVYRPTEPELRWNSFNAGELLLPKSRASLLFLLIVAVPLGAGALAAARKQATVPGRA